jgi:hypothetical protein
MMHYQFDWKHNCVLYIHFNPETKTQEVSDQYKVRHSLATPYYIFKYDPLILSYYLLELIIINGRDKTMGSTFFRHIFPLFHY